MNFKAKICRAPGNHSYTLAFHAQKKEYFAQATVASFKHILHTHIHVCILIFTYMCNISKILYTNYLKQLHTVNFHFYVNCNYNACNTIAIFLFKKQKHLSSKLIWNS